MIRFLSQDLLLDFHTHLNVGSYVYSRYYGMKTFTIQDSSS